MCRYFGVAFALTILNEDFIFSKNDDIVMCIQRRGLCQVSLVTYSNLPPVGERVEAKTIVPSGPTDLFPLIE